MNRRFAGALLHYWVALAIALGYAAAALVPPALFWAALWTFVVLLLVSVAVLAVGLLRATS